MGKPFTIYLAGAIEKSKDGGVYIRKNVRKTLESIPDVKVIDPCDFKINKRYKTLAEIVAGNRKWRSLVRKVIDGDIETVESVSLIVVVVNRAAGCGTTTEAVTAYRKGTPVVGYFTSEDVYKDRAEVIHPWLLASFSKECISLSSLKRIVESYMKSRKG